MYLERLKEWAFIKNTLQENQSFSAGNPGSNDPCRKYTLPGVWLEANEAKTRIATISCGKFVVTSFATEGRWKKIKINFLYIYLNLYLIIYIYILYFIITFIVNGLGEATGTTKWVRWANINDLSSPGSASPPPPFTGLTHIILFIYNFKIKFNLYSTG